MQARIERGPGAKIDSQPKTPEQRVKPSHLFREMSFKAPTPYERLRELEQIAETIHQPVQHTSLSGDTITILPSRSRVSESK